MNDRSLNWSWMIGVSVVHVGLVMGVLVGVGNSSAPITPPKIIGMLVSDMPSGEKDSPKPAIPEPRTPRPAPSKPTALPPVQNAPKSEHAVTTSQQTPPASASGKADVAQASGGSGQLSTPRSDATHLNNPKPSYPTVSRRMREQGRVLLSVYILPDGSVGDIKLKQSSGHNRLDQSALDAVRRWRYVPARRGNEPIPYWYVQPIAFSLDA